MTVMAFRALGDTPFTIPLRFFSISFFLFYVYIRGISEEEKACNKKKQMKDSEVTYSLCSMWL
jgi:uncharacterized membrane protein